MLWYWNNLVPPIYPNRSRLLHSLLFCRQSEEVLLQRIGLPVAIVTKGNSIFRGSKPLYTSARRKHQRNVLACPLVSSSRELPGHYKRQDARLAGPLVLSSRALLMFLFAQKMFFQMVFIIVNLHCYMSNSQMFVFPLVGICLVI